LIRVRANGFPPPPAGWLAFVRTLCVQWLAESQLNSDERRVRSLDAVNAALPAQS
jgi:hypothetical protein